MTTITVDSSRPRPANPHPRNGQLDDAGALARSLTSPDATAADAGQRCVPSSIIGRVATILGCFSHQEPTLTVTQLARRTGLAKSTTSRLVAELTQYGYLEHDNHGVSLGLGFFELGQKSVRPQTLRRLAHAQLEMLRHATGQTVHLAVLDGREVVYIDIRATRSTPALPSRVGGRAPAHATAVGKAMLAFSDPALTEAMIAQGLSALTAETITDPDKLRAALWRVRSAGVATERGESATGVACVAAPVLLNQRPVAAISVTGRADSLDLNQATSAVQRAVAALRQQAELLPRRHQAA